jgi:hypothetical protein
MKTQLATLFTDNAKAGDKFKAPWADDPNCVRTVVSTDREPMRNARILRTLGREYYFKRDCELKVIPVTA